MVRVIPRRRRTRILLAIGAVLIVVLLAAQSEPDAPSVPAASTSTSAGTTAARTATAGSPPSPSVSPTVSPPANPSAVPGTDNQARTFALALGLASPVLTLDSVLALIDHLPDAAEFAIIQREPPWPQLLAGRSPDELIDADYRDLVALLRDRGLGLILLVDPLDGLNRRHEAQSMVATGHSILEPEIAAMHEAWVLALARRLQPEYLGLASEINTPAAHGRRDLYVAIRDLTNRLAPRLRAVSPNSTLFVTFQVDDAWGSFGDTDSTVDQFALASEFDVDLIGLSSYPGVFLDSPADVPDDYYRRFADAAGGRPLGQFEGGWSSSPTPGRPGSPDQQVEWIRLVERLLDGLDARIWTLLTLTDLNLADPTWAMPADRAETLSLFAHMGLMDTDFTPKPAYEEWQRIRARPLAAR